MQLHALTTSFCMSCAVSCCATHFWTLPHVMQGTVGLGLPSTGQLPIRGNLLEAGEDQVPG